MKTRISPKTRLRKSGGMPATTGGAGADAVAAGTAAAAVAVGAPLRDGPRIEEEQLDVEQQEDDRHQVVAHVEPLPGVADRVHARLVRHLLDRGRPLRAQHGAGHQHPQRDHDRHQDEQEDRREFRIHDRSGTAWPAPRGRPSL